MKYSLVTRDLIADSTEAMAMAHQFDGLVMIPNCDKNVPGLLMAAARLNIPTIFCLRRPHAGRPGSRTAARTCLSHMFEAVGAYNAGKMDEAELEEYEEQRLPHLRLLLRHVHRQLHELPDRGHRHGPAGQRHHPRRLFRPAAAGQARRYAGHGAGRSRTSAPGTS